MRFEGRPFTLRLLPAELCGIISWFTLAQWHPKWLLTQLKLPSSPRWEAMGNSPVSATPRKRMHIIVQIRRVPTCAQIHSYLRADSNMRQEKSQTSPASRRRWRPSTHRMKVRWHRPSRHGRCGALGRKQGAAIAQQADRRNQPWRESIRVTAVARPPCWRLSNRARNEPVLGPSRNLASQVRSPRATPLVARSGRAEQAETTSSKPSADQK
ncbi:hypothetical protein ACVII1_004495 [Bradyrhizobium elkanii]|jgi:hypothetical protein|uniref:Uncharacterized protein n=1 Tax=Bradyrhizobium elkanii TaxID=29448 RepID=A0A8I1XYU4_BRAEL|nr:hypothetical protein [Bradyrhizobium elkanii]MCS4007502.1 hypothetical protein [Bradyrhizobium elkanii USDA 61]MBP2429075.1 hypothetical protein [Bradyrhizobium elkanii]MCP1755516.1 hypothetical protein [Bradyrhizobium elkanii]MCP1929176.1 hypothetical protein [Bradyrhizobium elkanii]